MSSNITKLTASDLAALLCARICHDLVGPVGALETGFNLLEDDENADMHDDAIELIKVGAEQASAKLKFLRIAFGAGGSAPAIIASDEIERLARGVYPDGKVTMGFELDNDGLDKPAARVLLNLVMLAQQAVPLGGNIIIKSGKIGDATSLSLTCTGNKARLDPEMQIALSGGAPKDGFSGRTIQPFYTGMIAREVKGSATTKVIIEAETVAFEANIPKHSATSE